jgi:hypothetical protein
MIMEKPNNQWINPLLGTIASSAAAASWHEQRLARALAERSAINNKKTSNQKQAKRELKGVLEVRSGVKQGIMTCDEGLDYCRRLGITDPIQCLIQDEGANNTKKNENNKITGLKNSSKHLKTNGDGKKTLLTDILLIESNLQTQNELLTNNYLNTGFINGREAFTSDCFDNDVYFEPIKMNCDVAKPSPSAPHGIFNGIASPSFFGGSSFAGLAGGILFLSAFFIVDWLKKEKPKLGKYFTSNEEYFITSHELLHKKLDTIIENKKEN